MYASHQTFIFSVLNICSLDSDSTMVFSDLMLSSSALLLGHVNENADQDDQYTLSIEESKSLDDFSRIQEIHE